MKDKFSVQSIEVTAQCSGVRQQFIGGIKDYPTLVDNLREWCKAGKTSLLITVTTNCLPIVVLTLTLAIQGPRIATTIQLANTSQVQAALVANSNNTITLVKRWPCRSEPCKNKGYNC